MPEATVDFAVGDAKMDESNKLVCLSNMGHAFQAAADRRNNAADQLASDSQRMWSVAMTTPTVLAGMGFRVAQQSGGWPADSGTGTGGKTA